MSGVGNSFWGIDPNYPFWDVFGDPTFRENFGNGERGEIHEQHLSASELFDTGLNSFLNPEGIDWVAVQKGIQEQELKPFTGAPVVPTPASPTQISAKRPPIQSLEEVADEEAPRQRPCLSLDSIGELFAETVGPK